jgi:hypothetical protein
MLGGSLRDLKGNVRKTGPHEGPFSHNHDV